MKRHRDGVDRVELGVFLIRVLYGSPAVGRRFALRRETHG
eukprot:SAG11_NODE_3407_length_2465_cov_8.333897_4_plen_40_part_00